jgi:hypothetical protein
MCLSNMGNTLNHVIDPGGLFLKDTQEATPAPTAPSAPPQASKSPSTQTFRNANQTAENAQGSAPSTLLTGSAGVNPNALQLGKNTLLGS